MQQTASAPARGTLATRPGSSRKLLQRKAAERAVEADPEEAALEDSFPGEESRAEPGADSAGTTMLIEQADPAPVPEPAISPEPEQSAVATSEPESAPLDAAAPAPAPTPAAAPAWSDEDESALQTMLARRKAAGYQPSRGKDVSAQLIRPGGIKPNEGTVVAAIVGIVAGRGSVARGALLDLMAAAAFPHAKARPADRGWCQGYVAGALRDGFLALADEANGAGVAIEASSAEVTA